MLLLLGYGIVLYFLNCFIDYKINHSYKRSDNAEETVYRNQLEESADVQNHRVATQRSWENPENDIYIEALDLKKVFLGFSAIKNNTFSVKKGEVFGLLGPNGAGKSTTFNVLSMRVKRSGGEARLMHENIDDINLTKG